MKEWNGIERKKVITIGICLLLGIIFLLCSEYSGTNGKEEGSAFDSGTYRLELEGQLKAILEEMDGVNNVSVMITLDGGEEYRYASQSSTEAGSQSLIYLQNGTQKEPILSSVGAPQIKGVSVVCKGAADAKIRLRITRLISSTLNLSENQIYVTE